MIGNRLFHEPRTTEHVLEVVREGIGLCKIGNTHDGPHLNADPTLCELSLAQPPIRHYCSGTIYGSLEGHGLPVPGRVASSHPAMPWLEPGHAVTLPSCGNICFPSPEAQVIVERDYPARDVLGDSPLWGSLRAPAVLAGSVGRGRALVVNFNETGHLFGVGRRSTERFLTTLAWLAEPRRDPPEA